MKDVMIVNNTKADLRPFHNAILACIGGAKLPEAIADIFAVEVIVEKGITKVIVSFI